MIVQVGSSIESSGAMRASQSLAAKVRTKVAREQGPVAVNPAAANVRADEDNNSSSSVNSLHMNSER